MSLRFLSIAAFVLALTGCAASVKHTEIQNKQFVTAQSTKQVRVSMNDEAKKKLEDNLKFDQNALLDHVKRAMTAQNLLNETLETAQTVDIVIKDIRVRSNFSAVMFGFMAGNDSVTGDVILRDAQGREVNRFEVSASYALGGLAGGQDNARMSWLYEKFAELAVQNLRGMPAKS